MKNPRAFAIALIIAVFATLFQWNYIKKREKKLLEISEPQATLVTTQDIPKNFRLDETMIKIEMIPRKWRQPGALSKVEEVVGQISAVPFKEGEQIVLTKLVSLEDAGLAFKIPRKKRGIAVAVDEVSAVGGHIRPGNYVDVIVGFDFGEGEKSDLRTVTLFQNILVLAVGKDLGQPYPINLESEGTQPSLMGGEKSYESITRGGTVVLSLSPLDCQKIVLAQSVGEITLTLRSLWEDERFIDLEKTSVHTTMGIPLKVRRSVKPTYRTIRGGHY